MAGKPRGIVFGSMGVAAVMALLGAADLAAGFPFGGQMILDVMFLLAGGLVIYMGVDCLKDLR